MTLFVLNLTVKIVLLPSKRIASEQNCFNSNLQNVNTFVVLFLWLWKVCTESQKVWSKQIVATEAEESICLFIWKEVLTCLNYCRLCFEPLRKLYSFGHTFATCADGLGSVRSDFRTRFSQPSRQSKTSSSSLQKKK